MFGLVAGKFINGDDSIVPNSLFEIENSIVATASARAPINNNFNPAQASHLYVTEDRRIAISSTWMLFSVPITVVFVNLQSTPSNFEITLNRTAGGTSLTYDSIDLSYPTLTSRQTITGIKLRSTSFANIASENRIVHSGKEFVDAQKINNIDLRTVNQGRAGGVDWGLYYYPPSTLQGRTNIRIGAESSSRQHIPVIGNFNDMLAIEITFSPPSLINLRYNQNNLTADTATTATFTGGNIHNGEIDMQDTAFERHILSCSRHGFMFDLYTNGNVNVDFVRSRIEVGGVMAGTVRIDIARIGLTDAGLTQFRIWFSWSNPGDGGNMNFRILDLTTPFTLNICDTRIGPNGEFATRPTITF